MSYFLLALAVVLILSIALIVYGSKGNRTMRGHARAAILRAEKDFQKTLDFSEGSLPLVDEILQIIHDRGAPELDRDATEFGAYLGEVIRKSATKSIWLDDDDDGYHLKADDIQVFPVTWARKRMKNGPEDSLVHKYRVWLKVQSEG